MQRFCPAKINLCLQVGPLRVDGFHELFSVVAPLALGDTLQAERLAERGRIELLVEGADVPADATNLVWRAAEAFWQEVEPSGGVRFTLRKEIPVGAGLGGGSSNGTQALRAMEELFGVVLEDAVRLRLAARLGSDCPLFLADGPVIFQGRGEIIRPLDHTFRESLRGLPVAVVKPPFGVATGWAFAAWRASPGATGAGEDPLVWRQEWAAGAANLDKLADLPGNALTRVVGQKYPALPVGQRLLREELGWNWQMSGSGSAGFILLPAGATTAEKDRLRHLLESTWGPGSFAMFTELS